MTSLRILEEHGMEFLDDEALGLLKARRRRCASRARTWSASTAA